MKVKSIHSSTVLTTGSVVGFGTVGLDQCPRPENPSINFCGSPSDLALIKNNVALIPTFSGSLLVVDVSTPQFPSLMTSYRPAGYSARRIAAVSEYAFTDADGNNMVLDLAVTSTNYPHGNIHTLDVTDPYNHSVLGVVKDSSGNVVNNIYATDITISKAAGLVYAAAGSSVYVIDIKDPRNPVILNVITQAPAASPQFPATMQAICSRSLWTMKTTDTPSAPPVPEKADTSMRDCAATNIMLPGFRNCWAIPKVSTS